MAFAKRVFMIQNRVKIPKQIKLNTKLGERDGEEGAKQKERERKRKWRETVERKRWAGGRGEARLRATARQLWALISFIKFRTSRRDSLNFSARREEVGMERGVAFRKSQTTRDLGKLENGGWHEVWGEGEREAEASRCGAQMLSN